MHAVIFPWLAGSVASGLLNLLWLFLAPRLFPPGLATTGMTWIPIVLTFPALLFGGYVSGRLTTSRSTTAAVIVGAFVGLTVSATQIEVDGTDPIRSSIWFASLLAAGAAVAAFGALLAVRRRHSLE